MENMHTDVEVYLDNSREIIVSIFNVINLSSKCCLLLELHLQLLHKFHLQFFIMVITIMWFYGTHFPLKVPVASHVSYL